MRLTSISAQSIVITPASIRRQRASRATCRAYCIKPWAKFWAGDSEASRLGFVRSDSLHKKDALDLCFGSHGRHRRDETVFACQQPRDIRCWVKASRHSESLIQRRTTMATILITGGTGVIAFHLWCPPLERGHDREVVPLAP